MRQVIYSILVFSFIAIVGFSQPTSSMGAGINDLMKGQALKWQGQVIDLGPLKKFYSRRRGIGIWTDRSGLNKKGKALLALIAKAGEDGLEPKDYVRKFPKKLKPSELGHADLYLSQALWRFGRDLSAGRTTPAVSEPDIVISRKKTDVTGWLNSAVRIGPEKLIKAFRPPHPQYALLKRELAKTKKGSKKARQLIVNMERWRWLPRSLGKRHVLVNQAAFEVYIREKGRIIDRRRVVIGKPYHKTPMFTHAIKYAEFNPTWTVSREIAGNEMLPKLRKDPSYLERNNYKLYTSWKKDAPAMSAKSVDWYSVNAKKFPYRIVQQPGDKNALGQVKFIFPNKFNVYLHDTQSKKLFGKRSRAFSHGCIRVEKPLDFALALFKPERSLNQSKMQKILGSSKPTRLNMRRPVPIHLAYFTAWVNEKGKLDLYGDVYKRDRMVAKLLFGGA